MYNFFLIVHNKSNKINAFYKKMHFFQKKLQNLPIFPLEKQKTYFICD